MSDLILRNATRARVARYSATMALVDFSRRAVEHFRRDQTGQDMVEYAGVLVIVALIITAVVAAVNTSVGTQITGGIANAITTVFKGIGGSSGGGAKG